MPDTSQRLRVAVDAITSGITLSTVTNVGAVATLTNQTQIGGLAANEQIPSLMHLSASASRNNIIVT
jgi:hypothetical protein